MLFVRQNCINNLLIFDFRKIEEFNVILNQHLRLNANEYFYKYVFCVLDNTIKAEYLCVCWICKLIVEKGIEELDEHIAKDHAFDDASNR